MNDASDRVRRLLRERSYREGEFELASGRTSGYYLDARQVTLASEAIELVGELFWRVIERYEEVEGVGGPTLGADPIVIAAAAAAHRSGHAPAAFLVRKEPKGHGTGRWLEGPLPAGARVAIVEDVVTSGGSALRAAARAEEAGCEVVVVVALVDRLEGGREAIEAAGYPFETIFTIEEIRGS